MSRGGILRKRLKQSRGCELKNGKNELTFQTTTILSVKFYIYFYNKLVYKLKSYLKEDTVIALEYRNCPIKPHLVHNRNPDFLLFYACTIVRYLHTIYMKLCIVTDQFGNNSSGERRRMPKI